MDRPFLEQDGETLRVSVGGPGQPRVLMLQSDEGRSFFEDELQGGLRELFEGLLPHAQADLDDARVGTVSYTCVGNEPAPGRSKSGALGAEDALRLRAAGERLAEIATDVSHPLRSVAAQFRVPDPIKDPWAFRTLTTAAGPRLLVLWGLAGGSDPITLAQAAQVARTPSSGGGFKWWWAVLPLLLLLLMLLGLRGCGLGDPAVVPVADEAALTESAPGEGELSDAAEEWDEPEEDFESEPALEVPDPIRPAAVSDVFEAEPESEPELPRYDSQGRKILRPEDATWTSLPTWTAESPADALRRRRGDPLVESPDGAGGEDPGGGGGLAGGDGGGGLGSGGQGSALDAWSQEPLAPAGKSRTFTNRPTTPMRASIGHVMEVNAKGAHRLTLEGISATDAAVLRWFELRRGRMVELPSLKGRSVFVIEEHVTRSVRTLEVRYRDAATGREVRWPIKLSR